MNTTISSDNNEQTQIQNNRIGTAGLVLVLMSFILFSFEGRRFCDRDGAGPCPAGRRDAPPVHRRVRQPARGAPDAGKRPAVRVSSSTTAGTMPRRTRLVTNRFSTPASFPRRVMVRLRVPPTDTMPQL